MQKKHSTDADAIIDISSNNDRNQNVIRWEKKYKARKGGAWPQRARVWENMMQRAETWTSETLPSPLTPFHTAALNLLFTAWQHEENHETHGLSLLSSRNPSRLAFY